MHCKAIIALEKRLIAGRGYERAFAGSDTADAYQMVLSREVPHTQVSTCWEVFGISLKMVRTSAIIVIGEAQELADAASELRVRTLTGEQYLNQNDMIFGALADRVSNIVL